MTLVSTIGTPTLAVTLVDAKKHLRVDHADDDAWITACVAAAQGQIDGPSGWLGRSIGLQTLEWVGAGFGCAADGQVALPCGPVQSIVSITTVDRLGVAAVLPSGQYGLLGDTALPVFGQAWPVFRRQADAVRIRYTAGYPDAASVPKPIWAAILLLTADLYLHRDAKQAVTITDNPTVERLLAPWRVWPG